MMKMNNVKKMALGAIAAMGLLTTGVFAGQANAATMTVKSGQTLSALAKQNGTTVQSWEYTNRLGSSKIYAGQKLNKPINYKVVPGDVLSYLAKRYGTTVADIESLNGLHSSLILAGQHLLIPVGKRSATVAQAANATAAAETQAVSNATPLSRAYAPATAPTVDGMAFQKQLNIVASAYGPSDVMWQYGGLTYTGTKIRQGIIAVDPSVIPLGSKVFITGYKNCPNLPQGGFVATAEDIGGAIKGNRIDIYLNANAQQVQQFGLENVKVYVLK